MTGARKIIGAGAAVLAAAGLWVSPSPVAAVGSGGLLNIVPQARVWEVQSGASRRLAGYTVYVHPFEGSLLLVPDVGDKVVALDKHKRHVIEMARESVHFVEDGIVDVPEAAAYTVLQSPPHFNRTAALAVLGDGRRIRIDVDR